MTLPPPRFKLIECAQGSPEWLAARAGCITASMFKVARSRTGGLSDQQYKYVSAILGGMEEPDARDLAGYKSEPTSTTVAKALRREPVGEFTEASKNYAFRLAVERISKEPLDGGYTTWAMERGHEMEPHARHAHMLATGVFVQTAGFVTTLDGLFGASADGLIGADEGSEYKCLVSPERIREVWIDRDLSQYMDQVMGCLWITGRKRWHFGMYCPALEPVGKELYLQIIERDEDYIARLKSDLWDFNALVKRYETALRK